MPGRSTGPPRDGTPVPIRHVEQLDLSLIEHAERGVLEALDRFRAPVGDAARDATDKDVEIGGAGLATQAFELGLVDELRIFCYPIAVDGGTPFLPPLTEDVPLDLIETRTFGSRLIYERYRRGGGDT